MIENSKKENYFIVDLDGTLIKSDMLVESFVYSFLKNPLVIFLCLSWLIFSGKQKLKEELSKRYLLNNILTVPVNFDVIELLKEKKSQNYRCYLVSASDELIVKAFFERFIDLFDGCFGSSKDRGNLSSSSKLQFLKSQFNVFEYVGNSKDDLCIWNASSKAYCVTKDDRLFKKVNVEKYQIMDIKKSILYLIAKQLRVHQWAKNVLIFIPIIAARDNVILTDIVNVILSFFAFSAVASLVYVVNDLIDLSNDRSHATKRNRPFASGNLNLLYGLLLIFVLPIIAVIISLNVSFVLLMFCIGYFILNILYSKILKKVALLDCVFLSLMYVYRVIVGSLVISINISPWLLSFSFFLFLSLSFVKRYAEIEKMSSSENKAIGRGYIKDDKFLLLIMSVALGFISVLICNLFYNSDEIKHTFKSIWFAYINLPILSYWLCRIYLITFRGQMNEDPVMFAIKDKVSLFLGVSFVIIYYISSRFDLGFLVN